MVRKVGTSGNETIIGTNSIDQLLGLGGNDTIFGFADNDTLNGGTGNDILNGGLGDDLLIGFVGADRLFGLDGSDNLIGGDGNDAMNGGAGDDTVIGGNGNDLALGSAGNDFINGGAGRDNIKGDAGNDVLRGGTDTDIIRGGGQSDILFGDDARDFLFGDGGNDVLNGGAGNDIMRGGANNDTLVGGAGNDFLDGELGADTAVFLGTFASYTITELTNGFRLNGASGIDTAQNIEFFQFADQTVTADNLAGKTFTLTNAIDQGPLFTGSVQGDEFNGGLFGDGAGVVNLGSTYTPGDNLDGAGGNGDRLNLLISGDTNGAAASGQTLNNIENVNITNVATDSVGLDAILWSGVQNISLDSGDSTFTSIDNLSNIVDVTMAGRSDLEISYEQAAVNGTSDIQNLTVDGLGDVMSPVGFAVSGDGGGILETLNIASVGTENYLNLDSTFDIINVSGGQRLTVDIDNAPDEINASGMSGGGLYARNIGASDITIVGSGSADTFSFDDLDSVDGDDSINGGGSNDTLATMAAATLVDTQFAGVSSVETLHNDSGASLSVTLDTNAATAGFGTVIGGGTETVNVTAGFTGPLTVDIRDGGNDNVNGTASTADITVIENASGISGDTLSGGSNAGDLVQLTADNGSSTIDGISGFETLEILAGATGEETADLSVNGSNGVVAMGQTLFVDASALLDPDADFSFDGNGETNGSFNILGGIGEDDIRGGSFDDTLDGGAGNDQIDGNDGDDTLLGSSGDDTFIFGDGELTSDDMVTGGESGETNGDTLLFDEATTINDDDFLLVTEIENIASGGVALTLNLDDDAANLGIDGYMGSSDDDTINVLAGFTGPLAVDLSDEGGSDALDASATTANITLLVDESDLDGSDTLTGGSNGGDVIQLTADGGSANLTGVSGFETISILQSAGMNEDVEISAVNANIGALDTLIVDGSALTQAGEFLTFNGALAETGRYDVTGGDQDDVLNGGGGNDILRGGAGHDTLAGATGDDTLQGGSGDDIFEFGADNITAADIVDGGSDGDGDTLRITDANLFDDSDLTRVTNVEILAQGTLDTELNATLGANAVASGIATANANGNANDTITIGAGYAAAITINIEQGTDTVDASASTANVTVSALVGDLSDADNLSGGTDSGDALSLTADDGSADLSNVSEFETITVLAGTIGDEDATFDVGADSVVNDGETLIVNALSLSNPSADFSFDGSDELTGGGAFNIMGGAGVNELTGGAGNDSLSGGSNGDILNGNGGIDTISGNAGNDAIGGGAGNDLINAGIGMDSVTVLDANNSGADNVTLGTDNDADTVAFDLNFLVNGSATITDFDAKDGSSGEDVFSVILANIGGDGTFDSAADVLRQSDGITGNDILIVLDNQTFSSLSDAAAVADSLQVGGAAPEDYLFVWEDNASLVHVAKASVDISGDAVQDLFVELATLQGVGIADIDFNDFTIV